MTGTWWLDVFVAAGIVAGGLGLLGMVGRAVRWMLRTWKRVTDFLDDWFGEEARPGVEARPGFPERITRLERIVTNGLSDKVADIQARVARIEECLGQQRREG